MLYLNHSLKKKNISNYMSDNEAQWDPRQLNAGSSFLQTLEWANFQQTLGNNYHLLSGPGWSCLLLEKNNKFGRYLFSPLGPTLDTPDNLGSCLEVLIPYAKRLGASWVKLEPVSASQDLPELISALRRLGAQRAVHDVQPHLTRVVNISGTEEDVMLGISQSTRSSIRKNLREKTISFKSSTSPSDMATFSVMLDSVSDRKSIGFYNQAYFTRQAEILMPAGMMSLELAYLGDKPVGGAVIHTFGNTSSYTYAASLPEARQFSVSALLLWQAIVNSKSKGATAIDLFGVVADDAPQSHPWYGFSTFKRKFGGHIVERAGTWDIPVSNKYKLYRAAQHAHHKLKRR